MAGAAAVSRLLARFRRQLQLKPRPAPSCPARDDSPTLSAAHIVQPQPPAQAACKGFPPPKKTATAPGSLRQCPAAYRASVVNMLQRWWRGWWPRCTARICSQMLGHCARGCRRLTGLESGMCQRGAHPDQSEKPNTLPGTGCAAIAVMLLLQWKVLRWQLLCPQAHNFCVPTSRLVSKGYSQPVPLEESSVAGLVPVP